MVSIHGKRAETRASRAGARSTAYTGAVRSMNPPRSRAGAVTATEVGQRKRTGREMALEQARELRRLEMERGSSCTGRSRTRGYARSGLQSPVSPSQHPTLNRHRGHCQVPCRHSIAAPQRRHGSDVSWRGSALTRSTVARKEDGYDDPRGAVAEWLGRGLQSLVQRFESARRLETLHLQVVLVILGLTVCASVLTQLPQGPSGPLPRCQGSGRGLTRRARWSDLKRCRVARVSTKS